MRLLAFATSVLRSLSRSRWVRLLWPWHRRSANQRVFSFLERADALERSFKRAILLTTAVVIVAALLGTPSGRYLASWLRARLRWTALWSVGMRPGRDEIAADRQRRRLFDLEESRTKLKSAFAEYGTRMQRLLTYAGLDPNHVLLGWGNFDRTLLLPSTLFETDLQGRSYRMKPNTRALWVRNFIIKGGILAFFMVPDTPELTLAIAGTDTIIVPNSEQTTNSWGLRGPEPDLEAPLRGIVLGDSFMQGTCVRDDETPPECLRRYLVEHLHVQTAILNTGHLGYSPEQYFYTLLEYVDRFRPQFVVVSVFANDFGDMFEVLQGKGDWEEGGYWLNQIQEFCRGRKLLCLIVPAPFVDQIEGARKAGNYPGQVSNVTGQSGLDYLDPIEDFVDHHLELIDEDLRLGKPPRKDPLFNSQIADAHFSALGSKVWGASVGRRLVLLIQRYGGGKVFKF